LPALLGTDTAVDLAPLLALLRGVDGEYQFVHALVRDGVYESLLKARRRDLHTRAADWYAERDAGLQAEHLDRADSPLAAEAYLKAAMREAARWRHDRARLLAARGLQLAQVPDLRHRLAMLLGEQLREVGRNREALEQFEMARDLAAGDAQTFRAWFQVASTKRVLSEVDGAMSALDAADGVLARWGDERDRSRVAHLRGNLHFAAGRGAACEQAHQTALTHARAAGDSLCEAQALSGLGDACYAAGDMSAAERYFAACVDICDRHAFRRFAIMNRGMLAVCGSFAGKLPQALQMLPAIGGEARVLGHANAQVMVEETLGICLNMAGRHRDAQKVNDAAFELARSLGSRRYEAVAATQRVHTLRQLGRRGEARAIAEQTWRVVVEIGAQGFVGPNVLVEWAACLEPGAQRDELLSRGAMLLERGVLAHTHVWYLVEAVALRLAERRTDDAERLADALQRWPHASSVAWVSHHAQAGRALVQAQRGDWSGALRRQLEALHASAVDLCYGESAARLSDALRQGDAGPLA
jgi:tetratricopeptide (TPR) repeat protein